MTEITIDVSDADFAAVDALVNEGRFDDTDAMLRLVFSAGIATVFARLLWIDNMQKNPNRANLPHDVARCLAHGFEIPQDWCERRATCARHVQICFDGGDPTIPVACRACPTRDFAMHIPETTTARMSEQY